MSINLDTGLRPASEVAKRMLWLAYEASVPVGMGFIHYTKGETEQSIWDNGVSRLPMHGKPEQAGVTADYCFGRMMKFRVIYAGSTIVVPSNTLDIDYQSWCGRYESYNDLFNAAIASFAQ